MEKEHGLTKPPVLFPLLIEEPKSNHQDAFTLNGVATKWSEKQSRLIKDAFPPSKNVLHDRDRILNRFHSMGHMKETKNYSCPNIVDMSSIIFCHDYASKNSKPRRIINGFFPNKVRSAQGSLVNDGTSQNRGRTTAQSQVGMCLVGRKDSTNLTGLRGKKQLNSKCLHGANSSTNHPEDHFDVRGSHWPVQNASPSPWLQRYKIKKRATTSYAMQKSVQNEEGFESSPKRRQAYMNLSNAVILDAF